MALNANTLATRYRMLPDQQVVALARNGSTIATVAGSVRRPLNRTEAAQFAALATERALATFLLPNINCSGQTPTNGDKITDASGVAWTILSVGNELAGSMWRCPCAQQIG